MMKLFKKKKSDKNISNTIVQQDTREFEPSNVTKQPKPVLTATIPVATHMDAAARSSSPPAIVMPKPRRLLTPTRAILGRFDHDKTQVEEDEPEEQQLVHQQEISPILLPTPRQEPLLPQLVKPVARHLTQPLQQQQQQQQYKPQPNAIVTSSLSTVMSDDSSRVYESALESLSDATEDDHVSELPDLPMLKKQPSYKPIVNPAHVPLPQQQQPQQLPTQVQQTSQQLQQHHMQQQLQQDIIASGILSDASSRTVSPQYYTRKRANTGPSSGSSAITVTPLQAQNKQTLTPIAATHCEPQPMLPPPPQPAQTLLEDQQQQQQQQQKDEQEFLLRELKKQVELIEKQRIKDREEWNRKEQELLTHRHQMMETLIETKDQLTHVLKNREEENNKAKLTYYDKQLKQQQLHQMQKQVIEMGMTQQQQQQQEEDGVDEHLPAARLNSHYYQQSSYYYENDPEAPFDEHTMDDDEAPMYHQRRIRNRSKSDEHIKHNTRSSSRSSYHYQQQQHPIVDDGGRRSNNSRNNYTNEDIVPASNRKPVSRRASNASNKSSGAGHRFDHTSPATTLVSNHTVGKSRRPRARSIESTRWHEEQQHQQQQQQHMMVQYMDEMMVPYEKLRKSRSAGRDLHSMRPVSRASSVYNMYYDEGELMDDELFDSQPSFYDSGYYSNYMENIPPNKQQQQQMMSRYNSDIPYYPPQQQQQQPQPPHQYVYSPVDYYYQQQAQPRHNQRYSARHHYSYN